MAFNTSSFSPSPRRAQDTEAQFFRARFRSFDLPPVRDALVVGTASPVSVDVLLQTLRLTSAESFVAVPVSDDVVAALIVRESLLKRLAAETISRFALVKVKPSMAATDVLRLDLDVEILIEGSI